MGKCKFAYTLWDLKQIKMPPFFCFYDVCIYPMGFETLQKTKGEMMNSVFAYTLWDLKPKFR